MSFASIAEQLGVSKTTLINWSKEMKEDLANLRQIHLEAIREKHRMGVVRRMEIISKQMTAVEGELVKRDLASVPTERLFDMLMRLGREFGATDTPMTFQQRSKELVMDFDDMAPVVTWQV